MFKEKFQSLILDHGHVNKGPDDNLKKKRSGITNSNNNSMQIFFFFKILLLSKKFRLLYRYAHGWVLRSGSKYDSMRPRLISSRESGWVNTSHHNVFYLQAEQFSRFRATESRSRTCLVMDQSARKFQRLSICTINTSEMCIYLFASNLCHSSSWRAKDTYLLIYFKVIWPMTGSFTLYTVVTNQGTSKWNTFRQLS